MKMLIVVFLMALAVPASIQAATLPVYQCEINKMVLAHMGVCAADVKVTMKCAMSTEYPCSDLCFDFCTGEAINTEQSCSEASECCWTGDECIFKTTPTYNFDDKTVDDVSEEKTLKRSKRQVLRSGVEGSVTHDRYGTTYSGRYNQAFGKRGNGFLSGQYHHPSNDWQVRGGYEHRWPNNGRLSISGNANSYGGRGAGVAYSRKFLGGSWGVNAGVQRNRWTGTNPTFGFRFSKRFGK